MSFFSKLRHTLGFADEPDFEIDEASEPDEEKTESLTEPQEAAVSEAQDYTDAREAIFCHVVAVFNDALPEFLARSVDPEAQRRLLYDKLDQGIKDYLARIGADADSRCEARWTAEQSNLRAEIETIRHKAEQVERERADLKQRQLSADRQKRALSDRLKDLESQVGTLEAEREQFELENKSLLNKLKVVSVQQAGVPDNDQAVAHEAPCGPSQEEFDALVAENARMRDSLEQAAERQSMADEMTADLRKRLKTALQDVDDLKAITEQVTVVQKAIEERDATILKQRDNIRRLKEQIDTLTASAKAAEISAAEREQELRKRVEELEHPVQPVAECVAEAAEPEPGFESTAEPKQRKRKARRTDARVVETTAPKITDSDLVDVEVGFADHEWFGVGDLAEAVPSSSTVSSDDDFGYHAPEPKPRPYDDGMQMSLFD